jgi:LuxR family maltose regulon positive regulatory protein
MPQKTILRTKLFRPTTPADFVDRIELFEKLRNRENSRLILVSAAAGYGKSATISRWLEVSKAKHTWLSLGEGDSDLITFLHYFLAAVHKLYPDSCLKTEALISSPVPCSRDEIAEELINNLSGIELPFHLILDDYGFLHDPDIHHILNLILEYDLPSLNLVVITRRDPPFNLTKLRGKGVLIEIRQADLGFSYQETKSFLDKAISEEITADDCLQFHRKLEGWPAGTRMVILGIGRRVDVKKFIREMQGDSRDIRDYLMSEVLSQQTPVMREYLVKTSILNKMCSSLCEELCDQPEIGGSVFLEQLQTSNLFCIPLDERQEWFRYHHLFQDLLTFSLEKRFTSEEIQHLHERAFTWLSEHGFIEDAMLHALKANNLCLAISLVAKNRSQLMEKEEWHRLRRLIQMIPPEIIHSEPEILMIEAWSLIGFPEMNPVLDSIEALMHASAKNYPQGSKLWGEFWVLRSLQSYLDTDGHKALQQASKALGCLPAGYGSERGFGLIVQALSMQMIGQFKKGQDLVLDALRVNLTENNTHHARLLSALCFIYWIDGSLKSLQQTTSQYLAIGQTANLLETTAHGHFFLGVSHYETNDVEAALFHLSKVVKIEKPLKLVNRHNYIHSAFALAYVYLEKGLDDEARSITDEIVSFALTINNPYILGVAKAFEADLALRLGSLHEAIVWSKNYDPYPLRPPLRFYTPRFTLAKVYLAEGTEESLRMAESFLTTLKEYYSQIHNVQFQIRVLALEALLNFNRGNIEKAIVRLTKAFVLAKPRGFIRTFVDLGKEMSVLLKKFSPDHAFAEYAGMLLAAFPGAPSVISTSQSYKANSILLTDREFEILSLLHQRLNNQEIADKLFISYGTVKRHTANIYRKLHVKNRREAVSKALSLAHISHELSDLNRNIKK